MDTSSMPAVLALRDSVTRRFFRRAFGIFIAFAILLTLILIGETMWQARTNLKNELAIYQRAFDKSLAAALWSIDREKLESIVRGIVEIPDIKGVRIVDHQTGAVLIQSGVFPATGEQGQYALVHRFDIIHDEGYGRELVARAEFHSSFIQLLRRTQGQILLIIVLATLKTLAFWWIFLAVGKRLLARPLTEMSESIAATNMAHHLQLSESTEKAIVDTELALLRGAYDAQADRILVAQAALQQANEDLEKRVLERTLELQEANRKLEELAHTDSLTGLANRRQFIALADVEIARARRSGRPLSVIVCDIDKFKLVNDAYGHLVGDKAICHVAAGLVESVRLVDAVGRFGGDEFVILLPDIALDEAYLVAERLRARLSAVQLVLDDGRAVDITLSIGVATLEPVDTHLEDIFQRADTGLFAAKISGRNRVIVQPFSSACP